MLFFWTFYSSKKLEKYSAKLFILMQHINNNYKCVSFLAANHNVRMISEGLCDWSNDTKNQLWNDKNKLHFIKTENSILNK